MEEQLVLLKLVRQVGLVLLPIPGCQQVAQIQRNEDRDRESANHQAGIAEARQDRRQRQSEMDFQRLNSLGQRVSTDYRQATKDFVEKKPYFVTSYRYLFNDEGQPRPTKEMDSSSDMAFRDSYLKMVHPNYKGSVFEKKELEKLANLPERFINSFVRLAKGNVLTEDVRYDMFNAMKRQFNTENEQQTKLEDSNRKKLLQSGMSPTEVDSWVPSFAIRGTTEKAVAKEAAAPTVPAKGSKYTEGDTADGPNGEKAIFTGGKWQIVK